MERTNDRRVVNVNPEEWVLVCGGGMDDHEHALCCGCSCQVDWVPTWERVQD